MWTTEENPPKGMPFFPRPVALISAGENFCAVGRMCLASADPFRIMLGLTPQSVTAGQIELRNEFALNFLTDEYIEQIDFSGHHHSDEVDKFAVTGLHKKAPLKISSTLIEEAFAIFECKLTRSQHYGDSILFFGEVAAYHHRSYLSFPEDLHALFAFGNGFYATNKQPFRWQPPNKPDASAAELA